MAFSDGSTGAAELTLRSRKIRRSPFLVLAAGLLLFAAAIGVCLLAMRPATLRIASAISIGKTQEPKRSTTAGARIAGGK